MAKKPTKPPTLKLVPSSFEGQQPPRKLGQHGTALWRTVTSEYNVTDAGGVEILAQTCAAIDRVEALAAQIDAEGEVLIIKGVPKSHPLLRDEIQIRAFVCRGLQKLGLNVEVIKPVGRPGGY